ncbi:hypothetical protein ACXIDX_001804 [Escherichia coli]|uniref:hypothetical protein n=1 Tax=Escherichia albertii TaxID=208962 RepID=UPI0018094FB2|nr:hypothetical protein [Escherichia albertii]EFL7447996.1 hypothetical protein [Escherichia coli]EGY0307774.1 hypothetical protein [Escherichia coli]EIY4343696.1 hypothetical protein [Escherichia coli]EMC6727588.1 hypothetical protein [Escherichia coli]WDC16214.1 hypothetical protein PS055_01025 [Escherichia albertii]
MKTVFAKDIEYTKNDTQSPQYYETILTEKCHSFGLIFKGFILPFRGTRTKIVVSDGHNDKEMLLISMLRKKNNAFRYTDEEKHTAIAKTECTKQGADFLGWTGGKFVNVQSAKMVLRCHEHNYIWDTRRYTQLRQSKKIYCPLCLGITPEPELRKQAIELCNKYNVDFIDWAEPFKGKETKMKLRCRIHNKYWSNTSFYLISTRGSCNCPDCTLRIKIANKIGYYAAIDKPQNFYIQLLDDKFIKFGVTVRDPIVRMKEQSSTSIFYHRLIYTHTFNEGWKAYDLESEIKSRFSCCAVKYKDMKNGWSETINIEELSNLQEMVNDYISNEPHEAGMWLSPKDIFDEDTFELTTHFYGSTKNEIDWSTVGDDSFELDLSPLEAL